GSAGTTGGGGTTGSAGTTGGGGSGGSTPALTLDQTGNPLHDILMTYEDWLAVPGDAAARLAADRTLADNMITWQLPHGGFYKNDKSVYAAPWNGTATRSGWYG